MMTLLMAPDSWQASETLRDVLADEVLRAALEGADVDDHVDLAGTVADGPPRLEGLDVGGRGPEREADHGRHRDLASRAGAPRSDAPRWG